MRAAAARDDPHLGGRPDHPRRRAARAGASRDRDADGARPAPAVEPCHVTRLSCTPVDIQLQRALLRTLACVQVKIGSKSDTAFCWGNRIALSQPVPPCLQTCLTWLSAIHPAAALQTAPGMVSSILSAQNRCLFVHLDGMKVIICRGHAHAGGVPPSAKEAELSWSCCLACMRAFRWHVKPH